MISVQNLVKNYGKVPALRNVSFEVPKGMSFGIIGPNGAGKTTAFKCLLGLVRPTSGSITIAGMDISTRPKAVKELIGYLPQRASFPENLQVCEVLEFTARLRSVEPRRVEQLLQRVGLAEHKWKRIRELSGGMLQRLGLAQALLPDPPILLMDEPTLSLDPQSVIEFKRIIKEEARRGKTILLASHILSEVEELCQQVAILQYGKIVSVSSIKELKTKLALRSTLWVVLEQTTSEAKELALRLGLDPVMNGRTIRMPANPEEKVAYLKALMNAKIPVLDFWT